MKRGISGAASELIVCADLMRKGYEIFRAVGSHSTFDLIAAQGDLLTRIEVRTVRERSDGTLAFNTKPTDDCDLYAFVCGNRIEYVKPDEIESIRKAQNSFERVCDVCGDVFFGARNARACSGECRRVKYEAHAARRPKAG